MTSDLPLFLCDNGLSILYTHTCDGFYHCFDESDEKYCGVPDKALEGFKVNTRMIST